jgi:hypothetical protein
MGTGYKQKSDILLWRLSKARLVMGDPDPALLLLLGAETRGGRQGNGGAGGLQRLARSLGLPLRTALLVGTLAAALGTVGLIEQVTRQTFVGTDMLCCSNFDVAISVLISSSVRSCSQPPAASKMIDGTTALTTCALLSRLVYRDDPWFLLQHPCVGLCMLPYSQASSDIGAHCVMAEAAVRIGHLEEVVTKLRHDELLTQV